jgi:hypothetical protein
METAVLRLGLAGFDAREQGAIREIAEMHRAVQWVCTGVDGADAWLVNGARVARTKGDQLRVITESGDGKATAIVLDAGSRPTALAVFEGVEPSPSVRRFDLRRPESLVPVLADFAQRLHEKKLCYWTAAHLVQHNATVGKAIFELVAGSKLIAVADMKGEVAISPTAKETDFDLGVWKHRARKNVSVPDNFVHHNLTLLLWQYTTRSARDLLPARYRECTIFFRRPPRLDPQLIEDVHLLVMRELAIAPATLARLQSLLKSDGKAVERALAALYFVGSVTSNAERASQVSSRGGLASTPGVLADDAAHLRATGSSGDMRPSTVPLL